jgi:phenylacetate-CoA ligase
MTTRLDQELAEQRRWKPRPDRRGTAIFDILVRNEFEEPRRCAAWQRQSLSTAIAYAFANVPYYRELARRLGLAPDDVADPADLPRLPILTKRGVYEHAAALRAKTLPTGDKRIGYTQSSGTTGRPTQVDCTTTAARMFSVLKQREYRWFRFDPAGKLAAIRLSSQLPPGPDGKPLADRETRRLPAWPYAGDYFVTGPFVAVNVTNPVTALVDWLQKERPTYLMTYSETLEHLALAWEDAPPCDGLRGAMAISEQLTPSMRRCIARTFDVPIHQNYGLNEVGLVAVQCEAGRYHVHAEHCLVEIVDEEGRPCGPGEKGRILVTALQNRLMPLIRYDTDDIAETVEDPCPCGRTLPAFGKVVGRYSRIAFLPEGTLGFVGAVRAALEEMPPELSRGLRQFQMHQSKDNRFELRLAAASELPEAFFARIEAAWAAAVGDRAPPLSVVTVDRIARGAGGKFQDFVSDFFPAPDEGEAGEPAAGESPRPEG